MKVPGHIPGRRKTDCLIVIGNTARLAKNATWIPEKGLWHFDPPLPLERGMRIMSRDSLLWEKAWGLWPKPWVEPKGAA